MNELPTIRGQARRRLAAWPFVLISVLLLIGLTVSLEASAAPSQTRTETQGKTLVLYTTDVFRYGDPALIYEWASLPHNINETLLSFNGANVEKPVPDLATHYSVSSDARKFTFTLRHNARFSDGTPLTSADVVFSLNRLQFLKGRPSWLVAGWKVRALGKYKVVITTPSATPDLPYILPSFSLGIYSSKLARAHGASDAPNASKTDKAAQWFLTHSAGSGPYMLKDFSTSTGAVLVANPYYWGPKPHFQTVVIRHAAAADEALEVQRGADVIAPDIVASQAEQLAQSHKVDVQLGTSPNVFHLDLNMNSKISAVTSNAHFRAAVRDALDYPGLLHIIGKGTIQAPGMVPIQFLGGLGRSSSAHQDIKKAKAELAASGLNSPSITLDYVTDTQPNGINLGLVAQKIQADLGAVGIKVNLNPGTQTVQVKELEAGTQEAAVWFWIPDYPAPSDYNTFLPGQFFGKSWGLTQGVDPKLEALGQRAAGAISSTLRASLYRKMQTELNATGPFVPLFQPVQAVVHTKDITNVQYNPMSWVDLWRVRPAG